MSIPVQRAQQTQRIHQTSTRALRTYHHLLPRYQVLIVFLHVAERHTKTEKTPQYIAIFNTMRTFHNTFFRNTIIVSIEIVIDPRNIH